MDKKKLSIVTGAALAFFSTGIIQADLAAAEDLTNATLVANHDGKEGGCAGKEGGCSGKEGGCSGKSAKREDHKKHDKKPPKDNSMRHNSETKVGGEASGAHGE